MITRRTALKSIAVGPLALSLGSYRQSSAQSAYQNLKIPTLYEGALSESTRQFQLIPQHGESEFFPGKTTATMGINGNYLGPTLRFHRNENVHLQINNQISEPTTMHWHGFHLPASQDGGPHQGIESGASWSSRFDVVQFAGTYWYHSHVLHLAGEQVYQGLAGLIIVEDEQQQVTLPSLYGVDDIPLIIQDRRFNEEGSFLYMNVYEDMVMGMHGDTVLVNGTARPQFSVSTRLVRFRLLNASNARTYNFAFSDNRQFLQIASDGGLLDKPLPMTRLILACAERAEIIVEFEPSEEVQLLSLARPPGFPEFPGALSEMMRKLNAQELEILHIRSAAQLTDTVEIPQQLNAIYRLPEAASTNTRQFVLSMGSGMRSGNDAGPGTGLRSGNGGGHGGGNFSINGRRMAMDFVNETIELNTTEIWELTNNSPMMHPFHIHNGQFQLLDRNGESPPANEMGWKDTIRVGSGEKVRIIMRFTDFSDDENAYMYHCHILEHEDRGMMGRFLVV